MILYGADLSTPIEGVTDGGTFLFKSGKWILPELIDTKSGLYKRQWKPFVDGTSKAVKRNSGGTGYLTVLVQGAADPVKFTKGRSSMTAAEKDVHAEATYVLEVNDGVISSGGKYRFPNPITNENLPNLRGVFLQMMIGASPIYKIKVALITGYIIGNEVAQTGANAADRRVSIFIIQTSKPFHEIFPEF